jgi:hypothetical protein
MICGDRFTQRWSMSVVLNMFRYGASSGVLRLAWSVITSSVEYTYIPCRVAIRRAMVDLPAPLPPPIQSTCCSRARSATLAAVSSWASGRIHTRLHNRRNVRSAFKTSTANRFKKKEKAVSIRSCCCTR